MKLSQILTFNSQRLISASLRYMLWQRLSAIVAMFPRLARAEMNAHRSEGARKVISSFETQRSEFWSIFAIAESNGTEYDITAELDRMSSTPRKPASAEQVKQLAEATGLSAKTIEANMQEQRSKALALQMESRKSVEVALYEGEFSQTETELDPTVPAEQLDAQAEKLVLWLSTWTKPDYAELMLIRKDRELLHKLSEIEDVVDTSEHFDGTPQALGRASLRQAFLEAQDRDNKDVH